MNIIQTNFSGNMNVGLYGYVNDKFGIFGRVVKPALFKKLEKLFDVPLYQTSIGGTDLIGVFCTGNENKLIVPSIISDNEKKFLEEKEIPFAVCESVITALGNVVLTDDQKSLVSPECDDFLISFLEKELGTEVITGTIAGVGTVGSMGLMGKDKIMVPSIIQEEEYDIIKSFFGKKLLQDDLMKGPYLHAAILHNSNGAVVSRGVKGEELFVVQEFFE